MQRQVGEKKEKERKLDQEFANRLKSIDLEEVEESPMQDKKKK